MVFRHHFPIISKIILTSDKIWFSAVTKTVTVNTAINGHAVHGRCRTHFLACSTRSGRDSCCSSISGLNSSMKLHVAPKGHIEGRWFSTSINDVINGTDRLHRLD